ncbi:cyanophycin synthetase [Companilactobacillus sp.]|uniref:bifunctional folylpolyglutamate synthase/dihydrofolate synthase n=1 Tax=Companilactobacillus sp. TaxID=2767905 RepID=UPI0026326508|nr:cyanophycin synthetase [Companilactobacillus sp.]
MTDKIQFDKIISDIPTTMKYDDNGSRIPLLRKVLDALGSPDEKFKTIHICGTNGKGSTSAMVYGLLQGAGYKVGVFSSPPMYDDREQIQFDQELISYADFIACYQELSQAFEKVDLNQNDISIFETWYLVSTIYFAKKSADYVVYECGLGGELDATNATRNVKYDIFTKIDMDHMRILGSTIEEIATTKSKIIREGIKVVSYPKQSSKVEPIIMHQADLMNTKVFNSSDNNVALGEEHLSYSIISLYFQGQQIDGLYFNLGGLYQITNLQNVLNWVAVFNDDHKHKITLDNVKNIIQTVTLPGRMELIQKEPKTLIDGAHNINAINGLVDTIDRLHTGKKLIFVVGFLADKQYQKCVDRLLDLPATFIITSPKHPERALPAPELMKIFKNDPEGVNDDLVLAESIPDAVEQARQLQKQSGATVIFAGSFYLINQIKPLWDQNRR